MAAIAQWEWVILELLFLGVLVYELISVRRSIRRAKQEEATKDPNAPPPRRWGAGLS